MNVLEWCKGKIGELKKGRKEPPRNKMNVVTVIRRGKEALMAMLCHCVIKALLYI